VKALVCALLASFVAAGCNRVAAVPGMDQMPKELAPFARKVAESRLPYVDVKLVIGPTKPRDSKLRGVPYYPKNDSWPVGDDGKPLVMLVQINFAEMPRLEGYPAEGILQIYISAAYDPDRQMWGMCNEDESFACLTDQNNFRMIYFPTVVLGDDELVTQTPVAAFHDDYGFPAEEEARLEFSLSASLVRPEDYRFRRFFGKDRDEFFQGGSSRAVEEEYRQFMGGRRYDARIGGYSRVEQRDPRLSFANEDWLLLFSLDSEGGGDYVVGWGGGGVGNFYIRRQDLAKRDFSKVMYYWDFG
jgi:uncharacterized protein YwqG